MMDSWYSAMAERSQAIKFVLRQSTNWNSMSIPNKEALENTATRIAMILEDEQNDPRYWRNLANDALLRAEALEPSSALQNAISPFWEKELVEAKAAVIKTMKPAIVEDDPA